MQAPDHRVFEQGATGGAVIAVYNNSSLSFVDLEQKLEDLLSTYTESKTLTSRWSLRPWACGCGGSKPQPV